MDVISKLNSIVNNVKEYIGVYQTTDSDYESILSAAVNMYSADLYTDSEKLKDAMCEFGATQMQITKVCMMTLVNGFREILEVDERIQQIDIDRYVQNAVRETGFNVAQVLELVSAIIVSLGIECAIDSSMALNGGNVTAGYVVPLSVYEDELKMVEQKLNSGSSESLGSDEIARLEVLAKAGISRAKYYLGSCLLKKEEFEQNAPLGFRYLEEAAADGDSQAAAELGDYFYGQYDSDSWSQAYSYYTRNGSLALNETRRKRVVDILNYRKFNLTTIAASILIVLAMFAMVIIAPADALYGAHRVWGCILFAVAAAIIAASIVHHRRKPYDNLSWVPCSLFIIWTLYFLIRIVF